MRKIILYILCGFMFVLCSCRSVKLNNVSSDYNFKYDLYHHIKLFYRVYLRYPTVVELQHFCWEMINEINDNAFTSFDEYESSLTAIAAGHDDLLRCLLSNTDYISFKRATNGLYVLLGGKKWIKIELDVCEMLKNGRYLTYIYDSVGHEIPIDDGFVDSLYSGMKAICQKHLPDSMLVDDDAQLCLLRYERNVRYQVYCPLNYKIEQNDHMSELGCFLDTFLLKRNAQTIQIATVFPQSYFKEN